MLMVGFILRLEFWFERFFLEPKLFRPWIGKRGEAEFGMLKVTWFLTGELEWVKELSFIDTLSSSSESREFSELTSLIAKLSNSSKFLLLACRLVLTTVVTCLYKDILLFIGDDLLFIGANSVWQYLAFFSFTKVLSIAV